MTKPAAARCGSTSEEVLEPLDPSLVPPFSLGMITAGENRWDLTRFLLPASRHPSFSGIHSSVHGPYLDVSRNLVIESWLDADTDVLIFLDSDVVPKPEALYHLAASCTSKHSVISGVYNSYLDGRDRVIERRPVVYRWHTDEETGTNLRALDYEEMTFLPPDDNPIERVDAVGAGFLAIHRDAIDALTATFAPPMPWFAEEDWTSPDGRRLHLGEDFTFCLRLASLNISTYVNRSCQATHFKTVAL